MTQNKNPPKTTNHLNIEVVCRKKNKSVTKLQPEALQDGTFYPFSLY